ncbi:MAG: peptidase M28, partial [Candidatus Latescibacterota bacterium]
MRSIERFVVVIQCVIWLALSLIAGCGAEQMNIQKAENSITKQDLERHVMALASDEFAGRKPFTEGETKTTQYLKTEFEKMGLEGANNGSYFQDVPLVEITADPSPLMNVATKSDTFHLAYMGEFVASTQRITDRIDIQDSDLVFAGYGIIAPEYDWNDYEGLDVEGKTVLVLVNDPGFATQDGALFKGNAMTYYGRWTYKYEIAEEMGA